VTAPRDRLRVAPCVVRGASYRPEKVITTTDFAFAVRPGEHACCAARPDDMERLAVGFVRASLQRGHKLVCLRDGRDAGELLGWDTDRNVRAAA
jgi:hypothetical protein